MTESCAQRCLYCYRVSASSFPSSVNIRAAKRAVSALVVVTFAFTRRHRQPFSNLVDKCDGSPRRLRPLSADGGAHKQFLCAVSMSRCGYVVLDHDERRDGERKVGSY